jgi:tRNA (guanine-N7-)-methyltransferase
MNAERTPTQPTETGLRRRPIRSFVLRQGRTTEAQKRAFELHWPAFGLDYAGVQRDFDAVFGRKAERVLEIGFGNGEQLAFAAGNEPARDFIGVEVHGPGVGRLLNALAADARGNVRVYQHDAVEVLREEVADGALDEVRIYFPDPWHKKKHNKRRLVNPEFVAMLCDKLRTGGRLHLATDWEPYAEQMLEVCEAEPRLRNAGGPRASVPRPQWRRQTHFETRGQKVGHGVWDLLYERT